MTNPVTLIPTARALVQWTAAQASTRRTARGTAATPIRSRKVSARVAAMALGAALLIPAVASAWNNDEHYRPASSWQSMVDGRIVDVSLKVDGETAPLYFSPRWADQRRYLEAYAGRNYSVVVRNNTGQRVGVLIAVDGLNVVNGERTRLSNNEAMYVLDPYEQAEIRGWRTSLDNVRRFVFVDEKRSYAERTGQANSDMGWIRVLSFREQRAWYEPGYRTKRMVDGERPLGELRKDESREGQSYDGAPRAQAEEAPASPKSGAAPQMTQRNEMDARRESGSFPGTGWGDGRYDPVQRTEFRAERTATDRIIVRYEYASALRALGIEPERGNRYWERDRLRERDGNVGFAKPPIR